MRENTVSMQPPRALWVSFPLGRPLGKPGDAPFQHAVIEAALSLLLKPAGPVLEDFPLDAPSVAAEASPACPVSFVQPESDSASWQDRLAADLASMLPWYELSQRRRGRSLVGVAEGTPQDNIQAIGRLLDEEKLPLTQLHWFKHAVEDLKVLYLEALTAQPGDYDPATVQATFWRESSFGAALIQFYHLFRRAEDPRVAVMARMLVPREAVGEDTDVRQPGDQNQESR